MISEKTSYKLITVLIYSNMVLYGFIQSMRGVVYPLIKNNFDAGYNQQGLLVLGLSVASVVFCVCAGIVLGAWGFRRSLLIGFATAFAGLNLFRFAGGFWIAGLFLLVIQMGLSSFEIGLNGMGVKTFVKKSALMMSLLHFFYGIGAIVGPAFAGVVAANIGWRLIYPLASIPVVVFAFFSFFLTPKDEREKSSAAKPAAPLVYFGELKDPMVWLFGVIMGFSSAVEVGTMNWGGLYLQDVYGLDPKTTGAAFMSMFFILYTASRFLSGFVLEKIGYLRGIFAAAIISIAILAAGFLLGRNGIWILPVSGFFVAIMYPTMLAISIGFFGAERAQRVSSVIIPIAFTVGGVLQYSIGIINRLAGPAWGYRSCLLHAAALVVLLAVLKGKKGSSLPLKRKDA